MSIRIFSPPALAFWGLLLGLALGAIAALQSLVPVIEPLGTLWINAIRMTVIPLVVSLLVTGVASAASARRVGRMGAQSIALFLILLTGAAIFAAAVAPFVFRPLVLDAASTAALRAGAHLQAPNAADISWKTWLVSLVPVNPIKAAADGTLLPVIVFTVAFAFALTRVEAAQRGVILRFFEAILEALLILIRWILKLTPIGVFALAFVVSARLGSGTLGAALGYYVGLAVVLSVITGIGLYLFATMVGRVSLRTFARAVFPAQVVGFTSRSSLTALPALIEGARDVLHLPPEVTGFVLPFAISVFKFTSPIFWTLGAQFVGRLYGIALVPSQLATVAVASILLNASTPGIPSGGLLIQAPLFAAIGLPVEGIGILIAIDAIPDMFKSALILASDMTVGVVVAHWNRGELPAEPAAASAPT